jgi:Tfp pilus assembly protein PilF
VLIHQLKSLSVDLTDRLYQHMVKVEPNNAEILDNYALFLEQERADLDRAELYYKRTIEAEPTSAVPLVNYALFLWDQRGDIDGAEEHFKRAIETEPDRTPGLADYAVFLWQERGDMDSAEVYFKRAIEAAPTASAVLGNYGQFLVALGRFDEGGELLLSAFQESHSTETADLAEFCFSLWLVARMQGHDGQDAERWGRGFKFLIQQGFKRPRWNFDRMLEHAEKHLPPDEFDYAKALAQAFLDEGKVAELERYERWRALEPLNLKQQEQQVTVRSAVRTSR